MTFDLFENQELPPLGKEHLAPGAVLLRAFAYADAALILEQMALISARSPFRHMTTPGGYDMSVAMTNCGNYGWVTDRRGYRYTDRDPITQNCWPEMPNTFYQLAINAAREGGFDQFQPDVCLINRYAVGAKMSLHQDKDETDFAQPIVSLSFGLPAIFQFGGMLRSDTLKKVLLTHGDVVVWGGDSRLVYHGILPIKDGDHRLTGPYRINMTFRKSG